MNKSEALNVMHEIYESVKESIALTCVSLDVIKFKHVGECYQIRLKGELDVTSRRLIETILGKHKLNFREEEGYVLIF